MAWSTPRTWVNGEVVTQTELNTDVRDNMRELWHEIAYVEFTADVSVTGVAEASPTDVVSSGAITYAALPIIIEFRAILYDNVSQAGSLSLWDGATDLGRITQSQASVLIRAPVFTSDRLTPTAASHTYKVRMWGTATVYAGAGGVGTKRPGFIRILQRGG
jgi:hypothetical protein